MDLFSQHYYAVKKGNSPGIYTTWDDCRKEIEGYSSVKFKKFSRINEAIDYLREEYPNITPQITNLPSFSSLHDSPSQSIPSKLNSNMHTDPSRSIESKFDNSPHKLSSPIPPRRLTEFKRSGSMFSPDIEYSDTLIIYIEGHCSPSPGDAGFGFIFKQNSDEEILRGKKFIGFSTCPKATYKALICALKVACKREYRSMHVYSNLECVVKQMKGQFKAKELAELNKVAMDLVTRFQYFDITYIPKKSNLQAFALAEDAIRTQPQDLVFC